jgi:hypothetical protein
MLRRHALYPAELRALRPQLSPSTFEGAAYERMFYPTADIKLHNAKSRQRQ